MIKLNNKHLQWILIALSILLYFNTLFNKYALDDKAITYNNTVTKSGLKGVKAIFTHHYYYGAIEHNTGIYRPLTSLTHAIEWQFLKENPFVSHLVNIGLYAFVVVLLFQTLQLLFKEKYPNSYIPFIAASLFALHPIHTEVVANIKGRDELLALLFMLLALKSIINSKTVNSLLFFLLSLLCKESSILFIGYLALILYFFSTEKLGQIFKKLIPYLGVAIVFLALRSSIIGNKTVDDADAYILNLPYLYASTSQAFATKIFVMCKYLYLLLFPHPLVCDYTFNQIPYINIEDVSFFIAATILLSLLVLALVLIKRKHIISFSILFYFVSMLITSNLLINTSVVFAERAVFVGSLAFCLTLAYGLEKLFTMNKIIMYVLLGCLSVAYAGKTVKRNTDWKNDFTLFNKDVKNAPNSARLLNFSAMFSYFHNPEIKEGEKPTKELRDECVQNFQKAIAILPDSFPEPYVNLSYIYWREDSLEKAITILDLAKQKGMYTTDMDNAYRDLSSLYVTKGRKAFEDKNLDEAFFNFKRATEINPQNAEAWWNYGGVNFEKGNRIETIKCWETVQKLNPNYPKVNEMLGVLKGMR